MNSALLEIISECDQEVKFFAESSHLASVQQQLSVSTRERIEFSLLEVPPRRSTFRSRIAMDYRLTMRLARHYRTSDASRIVFTAATPGIIYAARVLLANRWARVPVQVVLHGGLAVIRNRRARNPLKRVVDTQSALEFGRSKYLQYLVMEKCIRRMFFKIMPSLADSVDVLEHPFPIAETGPERLALEAPVRFSGSWVRLPNRRDLSCFDNLRKPSECRPLERRSFTPSVRSDGSPIAVTSRCSIANQNERCWCDLSMLRV